MTAPFRSWICRRAAVLLLAAVMLGGPASVGLKADALSALGVSGGLVVVVGDDEPVDPVALTAELRGSAFLAHALYTDAAEVSAERARIRAAGLWGDLVYCRTRGGGEGRHVR